MFCKEPMIQQPRILSFWKDRQIHNQANFSKRVSRVNEENFWHGEIMITRFFLNYRGKLVKATLSNQPFLKSEWINVREKVLIGNREKFSLVITEKRNLEDMTTHLSINVYRKSTKLYLTIWKVMITLIKLWGIWAKHRLMHKSDALTLILFY